MNVSSVFQSNSQGRIQSRSMGIKLILVCGLALMRAGSDYDHPSVLRRWIG
jgi:hypothetical protein